MLSLPLMRHGSSCRAAKGFSSLGVSLWALWMLVSSAQAQDVTAGAAGPSRYHADVGQPHPDFVLPRIDDGSPLRLSDLRGKKVLLVHFASW